MSILHEFDFVSLFKITLRTLLLKPGLYLELHDGYLMLYWNCLSFQGTWVHPPHGLRVARSLVFCLMFCRSFCHFVPFLLAIVLSVLLRFTVSAYPFGIFKLFFISQHNIVIPDATCQLYHSITLVFQTLLANYITA
jgi:hypothetical protein